MVETRAHMKKWGRTIKPEGESYIVTSDGQSEIRWNVEEHLESNLDEDHILRFHHPHKQNGYRDDNKYKKPYRHLHNWYLARAQDEDKNGSNSLGNSLVPLPKEDCMRAIYLFGELVPKISKYSISKLPEQKNPERIVIRNCRRWTIDKSHDDRGYWVESVVAWYYLKKPDPTEKCPSYMYYPTSMEKLFLPNRALLGLFSNFVDMLGERHSEERKGKHPYYANVHKDLSPEKSHYQLSASEEDLENDPSLIKEPFDLCFLELGGAAFVRRHLRKSFIDITDNCELMKGLRRLEQKYEAKKSHAQLEYLSLAEAAEARSQRYPWGEQIKPNDLSTKINKRYLVQGGERNIDVGYSDMWRRELLKVHTKKPKLENDEKIDSFTPKKGPIDDKKNNTEIIIIDSDISSDEDSLESKHHREIRAQQHDSSNDKRSSNNDHRITFDQAFTSLDDIKEIEGNIISRIQGIMKAIRKQKCLNKRQEDHQSLEEPLDHLRKFDKVFRQIQSIDLETYVQRMEHSSNPS